VGRWQEGVKIKNGKEEKTNCIEQKKWVMVEGGGGGVKGTHGIYADEAELDPN